MNLPTLESLDLKDKKVIVRADLDVPVVDGKVMESARLEALLPTLNTILDKGAKQIIIIGHMGRPARNATHSVAGGPEGKHVENFSLKPIWEYFKEHLTPQMCFVDYQPYELFYQISEQISRCEERLVLLDNLRFWPQEEENSGEFAKQLADTAQIYVNEAFASSHRQHASIVGIPKIIPSAAGLQFSREVDNLSKVIEKPKRPVIAVISGVKKDKLQYLEGFKKFCDKILLGGRLPEFMDEDLNDSQLEVAKLNPDKEDITIHSIERFEEIISDAGTIILAGPLSRYEDQGHKLGTERVFIAVSRSNAFKVAGGGETLRAIHTFNIEGAFDWISTGGGAALEFLAKSTLPGIEALNSK